MSVYIDHPKLREYGKLGRVRPSSHLMANTREELHEFAQKYDINRCWFDASRKHTHYDLSGESLQRVLAVLTPISSKEMLRVVKSWKK